MSDPFPVNHFPRTTTLDSRCELGAEATRRIRINETLVDKSLQIPIISLGSFAIDRSGS